MKSVKWYHHYTKYQNILIVMWFIFILGKKKFPSDPSCCPVCGVTVRPQELEQHFAQELDRLYKVSSASSRPRPSRSTLPPTHPQDHSHGTMLHAPSAADGTPQGRWETYKRIKANRQVMHSWFPVLNLIAMCSSLHVSCFLPLVFLRLILFFRFSSPEVKVDKLPKR